MIRRSLTGLLTAALLVSVFPSNAAATTGGPWRGPCGFPAYGENDSGSTPLAIRQAHTRALVACVFDAIDPSQTGYALYIANRESHFYPDAQNPSSLCSGVFQDQLDLWPGRTSLIPRAWLASYLWRHWSPDGGATWTVSPFNAYSNVLVAAFMVKSGGWAPWGG